MAALKKAPAKGKRPPKKGFRGRMPTKRSINLVLIDEKKIKPMRALPAIVLIVVLAAVFSKFMVMDRLMAMSKATGTVSSIRSSLMQASEALKQYEGVEDVYAHMTNKDMTKEELNRVDRVKVLELVSDYLSDRGAARSWTVSGNILVVDVSDKSLENLNLLARRIEQSPIVDTCVITAAQKDMNKGSSVGLSASQSLAQALEKRRQEVEGGLADSILSAMSSAVTAMSPETVVARFTIYLHNPVEPEATAAPEATVNPEENAGTGAEPSATEGAGQQDQSEKPQQTGVRKPARQSRVTPEPEEVSAP